MSYRAVLGNASYLKQQLQTVVDSSTIVMKMLVALVVIGYGLGQVPSLLSYIVIQPSHILPTNLWVWTYLTSPFIELHWWQALFDVIIIVLYGKLLQPLWGPTELFCFYFVLNIVVELLVTIFYVVLYYATGNEDYLFDTYIYGQAACLAGFLVAVKQVMGSQVVINSPFGKLRNRDIPVALFYIIFLLTLLGAVSLTYLMLYAFGLITSWVYLRFYQRHANGKKGDQSNDFAFVTFFPYILHGPVKFLSDLIFNVLVKLSLCAPFQPTPAQDLVMSHHHTGLAVGPSATVTLAMPSDALEAERRKAKALKALEERLSKLQAHPVGATQWPSLDDAPSSTSPSFTSPNPEQLHALIRSQGEEKLAPSNVRLPVPDFKAAAAATAQAAAAQQATSVDSTAPIAVPSNSENAQSQQAPEKSESPV